MTTQANTYTHLVTIKRAKALAARHGATSFQIARSHIFFTSDETYTDKWGDTVRRVVAAYDIPSYTYTYVEFTHTNPATGNKNINQLNDNNFEVVFKHAHKVLRSESRRNKN